MTGSCEQGSEILDFIKGGKFHDYLNNYHLLKKEHAIVLEYVYH
jgi:hypothetical protein